VPGGGPFQNLPIITDFCWEGRTHSGCEGVELPDVLGVHPRVRVCPERVEFGLVGWVKPTDVRPSRWVSPTLQRFNAASGTDSQRFLVSLSFVVRLSQLHRRTGSLDPKPSAGGRPAALGSDDLERLKELVRQQPDATLKELRQRLGVSCSLTAIWRAREKLRLSR
jgi:hypothetical protein